MARKKMKLQQGVRPIGLIRTILFMVLLVLASVSLVRLVYAYTFAREQAILVGTVIIWAYLAYIIIPRAHRWLTRIYLPDYYIGRSRTGDGLLADPINLAFNGSRKDIIAAMKEAGWVQAEPLNRKSTWKMIKCTVLRRSYANAPVSSLFLFSARQDFAFQQEVGGSTSKRHHVRFWKVPEGWFLPGGMQADWLAAATFDRRVGFSAFTLQVTHKIEADIDKERDYLLDTLMNLEMAVNVNVVENFSSAYHGRNGGGDFIHTDGAMPFVTIAPHDGPAIPR